jgi:ribonuclease E
VRSTEGEERRRRNRRGRNRYRREREDGAQNLEVNEANLAEVSSGVTESESDSEPVTTPASAAAPATQVASPTQHVESAPWLAPSQLSGAGCRARVRSRCNAQAEAVVPPAPAYVAPHR